MRLSLEIVRTAILGVAMATMAGPTIADQPEDAWITTKVKMALLTDNTVDALDLNVDTFDGQVTLHGEVDSEAEQSRAERLAEEVRGVVEVRNLLEVVPESAQEAIEVDDEKLEERVSTVLERDGDLENSDIEVKSVTNGVVVLSGDANTLSAHERALEDARSVDGVRHVASEIQSPDELGDREIWSGLDGQDLSGAMTGAVSDAWITTQAKIRLLAGPGLSPFDINVDTNRGIVTLFGSVGAEDVRAHAEAQVKGIEGVKAVVNELHVAPQVAAGRIETNDRELAAAVRERLDTRGALSDAEIEIEVEDRVVRLTGTVATQRDRLTALEPRASTRSSTI